MAGEQDDERLRHRDVPWTRPHNNRDIIEYSRILQNYPQERLTGVDLGRPLTAVSPTLDAMSGRTGWRRSRVHRRQVHQVAGRHSEKGVRNCLHRLVGQGILLNARPASKADLYSLNRRHLLCCAVHRGAGRTAPRSSGARIRAELAGWNRPPSSWRCSARAATGRMRPDSDIDLLVVRPKECGHRGCGNAPSARNPERCM